jgi:hypothetical protein
LEIFEFINIFNKKKQENPFLFEDTLDVVGTDLEIREVEQKLAVALPQSYKEFVKKCGGGDFGYIDIFSVNKQGCWYIVKNNQDFKHYLPKNFIAISDDQTGGYYGYKILKDKCEEQIFYWHYDGGFDSNLVYQNIFDYIIKVGFKG